MKTSLNQKSAENITPPDEKRKFVNKALATAAADLHLFSAHDAIIRSDLGHVFQINEIAIVATRKMLTLEFGLHIAQTSAYIHIAVESMKNQMMPDDFYIFYRRDRDAMYARLTGQRKFLGALQSHFAFAYGAAQFYHEIIIQYRLDYEIERTHFITVHGILNEVGNKDQSDLSVRFAKFTRGVHSAEIRHFNIHKHYIAIQGVFGQKRDRVGIFLYFETFPVFFALPLDIAFNKTCRFDVIFYYTNFPHTDSFLCSIT